MLLVRISLNLSYNRNSTIFLFSLDHFYCGGRERQWVLDESTATYVKKTVPLSPKEDVPLTDGQKYVLLFEKHSPELRDVFEHVKKIARKEFKDRPFVVTIAVHDEGTVLHRRLARLRGGGAYWRLVEDPFATSTPRGSPKPSLKTSTVSGIPKRIPGLMDKVNAIN